MKTKTQQLVKLFFIPVIAVTLSLGGLVGAETFQSQINNLNTQNSGLQAQRQDLLQEAESLEAVISSLGSQIAELQSQINNNQAKMVDLKRQIIEAEAEIVRQQELMGDSIRAMYLEGDISTLEILASSKDLSEYLDREQYRNEVQNKVKTTLDRIRELREQLEAQKLEIEKILADQRAIQVQLDVQRGEQSRLLSLNEGQRSSLSSQIKSNTGKIADLRRQQAAANARLFGSRGTINVPDTTGYPWANVSFPNTVSDPWGMYKRQCVSYTAWKVWKSGRHMPFWGGRGNANQWDDNARAAGIPVDGSPRVGDIAVSNSGYYGHVMYVEAVYDDGTIYVSQYNANWGGTYSEARVNIGSLVFIHF